MTSQIILKVKCSTRVIQQARSTLGNNFGSLVMVILSRWYKCLDRPIYKMTTFVKSYAHIWNLVMRWVLSAFQQEQVLDYRNRNTDEKWLQYPTWFYAISKILEQKYTAKMLFDIWTTQWSKLSKYKYMLSSFVQITIYFDSSSDTNGKQK